MSTVKIGKTLVGDGQPCYVIAEIGINHNGDLNLAKKLISVAVAAGCNAVKFQKRTPELCVPVEQRGLVRETPWGLMTYMDYRYRVEFERDEYREIDRFCRDTQIPWLVSCWDAKSVDFIEDEKFDIPCYKVASASLTDDELLRRVRATGRPIILSTGMSTLEQIDHAVEILGKRDLVIMHTTSTYPAAYAELNLKAVLSMKERYGVPIGYSGHETGIPTSVAAAVMGACMIERHITLDRAMWGSDQAASLEPNGINRLVRDIRLCETSMGDGVKRVFDSEKPIIQKLRRVVN